MLIYVAGPYTADTEDERIANVERAMAAGLDILGRGHWPLIPHLSHYVDVYAEDRTGRRLSPHLYYAWDMDIVWRCDALLYLAPSFGADREKAVAEEMSMPVYLSIDDIPFNDE